MVPVSQQQGSDETDDVLASVKADSTSVPVDKMRQYRTLVERTVDVFGDEIKASIWLSLPNVALYGKTPLQIAQENDYSLHRLESLFVRIEHGIEQGS